MTTWVRSSDFLPELVNRMRMVVTARPAISPGPWPWLTLCRMPRMRTEMWSGYVTGLVNGS